MKMSSALASSARKRAFRVWEEFHASRALRSSSSSVQTMSRCFSSRAGDDDDAKG